MRRREFIKVLVGSASIWPLAAHAQQPDRVRHIGYLNVTEENDPQNQTMIGEFTQRLQELGWTSGRNVLIDFRFGGSDPMRISQLATELVEGHPDLIIASGTAGAAALRQQSLSIPIVFVQVVDPVLAGFVTNLARPEGNITGFTNFEFSVGGKWLQLLKLCAPAISRIAVVFDPANPSWAAYLRTIEAAAPSFGVQLTPAGVRDAAEIKQRVAAFARGPNGACRASKSCYEPVPRIDHCRGCRTTAACDVSISLLHRRWGPHVVWVIPTRRLQGCGVVCRSDSKGSEGGRSADPAADQVRAGNQPQDCQRARSDCSGNAACSRRRGDRVGGAMSAFGTKRTSRG